MLHPFRHVVGVFVGGLAVAAALAGCTSTPAPTPTPTPKTAVSTPTSMPNVPVDVPNVPADRANVAVTSCAAASGGWSAGGTVKNPGTAEVTYTITVFFTNQSATVVGASATKISVEPGKSKTWKTSSVIANAADLRCVLRGVG